MLSKTTLEQLIAAWPDDNGFSSNPEIYDAWLERERRCNARIIQNALGRERVLALSERQKVLLERSYVRLLSKKDITQVSDEEILGRYELITEHVSPSWLEAVTSDYQRRYDLN